MAPITHVATSSADHDTDLRRTSSALGLAGWLALTILGGALVGVLSNSGAPPWYGALDKPSWTPPSWVFAPVWTTLYAMMGVAAWMVWRRVGTLGHPALRLFLVQLTLNFAWSFLFFRLQRPDLAMVDIALLWLAIVTTIYAFARYSAAAAWLLAPYLAWVSYAAALNAWIVRAN